MRVSYLEMTVHCRKVFEACGIPYGYAEEGAEVVAWGQFVGLSGLKILEEELPALKIQGEKKVQVLQEKEFVTLVDGGRQSGLLLGKAIADYAIARLEKVETATIAVQNTTSFRLLAHQAPYLAAKGKACIIHYSTKEGLPVFILATPSVTYPIVIDGRKAEDVLEIFKGEMNEQIELLTNLPKVSNGFKLYCTKYINGIDHLIEKILNEMTQSILISPEQFKKNWSHSCRYGAEVERTRWDALYETGRCTLVESSELSRLRGAGELA